MAKFKAGNFEIYRAKDGWRWRMKALNGRVLADSGQAYTGKKDCVAGIVSIKNTMYYGYDQMHLEFKRHGYDYSYDRETDRYVVTSWPPIDPETKKVQDERPQP